MAAHPATRRQRAVTGTIAGFVLRLARESIPLTQVQAAEVLDVDLGTIQGRESGRRPLAAMKAGGLLALRRRLLALGADRAVLALLEPAMDADRLIEAALDPPSTTSLHPLASWVHTRATAHMISWAVNGVTPPALQGLSTSPRRGPAASAPLLAASQRAQFFHHLRGIVEAASTRGEEDVLLRRQALYFSSYDSSPEARSWTAQVPTTHRGALMTRGWSPTWPEARTIATALARQGDPEPLLAFIDRTMINDDRAEAANLNYWAYWLGAVTQPQADDTFMNDYTLTSWDPVTLLRHMVRSDRQSSGFVDLYAHSLWSLVEAHRWLPQAAPTLAAEVADLSALILDEGQTCSRARHELSVVHFVLRQQT